MTKTETKSIALCILSTAFFIGCGTDAEQQENDALGGAPALGGAALGGTNAVGGTQAFGGTNATQATIAWFRVHLMGDEAYRSWFYGPNCHLCDHSNWSIQRKGMD